MAAAFAAVDWGTSSFRLWLMAADGTVLAERRSGEGMTTANVNGFSDILEQHLAAVGAPETLPVIICGMAGARQGWVEAGYADTPALLSAITDAAVTVPGQRRDIRILPGLAQRGAGIADVMRGEETQLLGASGLLPAGEHLVCMPGTHSKWVRIANETASGFSTYMTGELFEALSRHTLLSHSVENGGAFDGATPSFLEAVAQIRDNPSRLTSQFFSIRAAQLLNGASTTDGRARLSGTLIGAELAGALSGAPEGCKTVLVVSGGLGSLYLAAFAEFGLEPVLVDADEAVRNGLTQAARRIWRL